MQAILRAGVRFDQLPDGRDTHEIVVRRMTDSGVRRLVAGLPDLERRVAVLYWGLLAPPVTLAEIAAGLGITEAAAARLHRRGMDCLRRQATCRDALL